MKTRSLTNFLLILASLVFVGCEDGVLRIGGEDPDPLDFRFSPALNGCGTNNSSNKIVRLSTILEVTGGTESNSLKFKVGMKDGVVDDSFIDDWTIDGFQHFWEPGNNPLREVDGQDTLKVVVYLKNPLPSEQEFTVLLEIYDDSHQVAGEPFDCQAQTISSSCSLSLAQTTGNETVTDTEIVDLFSLTQSQCEVTRFTVSGGITDWEITSVQTGTSWTAGELSEVSGTDQIRLEASGSFDPDVQYELTIRAFDAAGNLLAAISKGGYQWSSPAGCDVDFGSPYNITVGPTGANFELPVTVTGSCQNSIFSVEALGFDLEDASFTTSTSSWLPGEVVNLTGVDNISVLVADENTLPVNELVKVRITVRNLQGEVIGQTLVQFQFDGAGCLVTKMEGDLFTQTTYRAVADVDITFTPTCPGNSTSAQVNLLLQREGETVNLKTRRVTGLWSPTNPPVLSLTQSNVIEHDGAGDVTLRCEVETDEPLQSGDKIILYFKEKNFDSFRQEIIPVQGVNTTKSSYGMNRKSFFSTEKMKLFFLSRGLA